MSRISQYPLDTNIEGNDKWIGTSVNNANATKNFSVDNVIQYINSSGGVDSQNLRYTYQNVQGDDVRLASTISFTPSLGDNVPFAGITEWTISAFSKEVKDVRTYYNAPLVGSTILITNAFNPSNWAIFRWDSVTVDILDPDFYTIALTHIDSTGELVVGQDYLIALLDSVAGGSATWGSIIGTLSSQTDLQTALNAKQATLVSGTNIKTINSTSLLGSGDIVIATLPSGVAGAIQFSNGSAFASDATNFFWDDTNNRLGIGINTLRTSLDIYNYAIPPIITVSSQKAFDVAGTLIGGIQGIQHPTLTAPSTAIYFKSETGNAAQGKITFETGSALGSISEKMVIGFNGNVGIGAATPTAKLQIKGSGATSATTSLLVQNSALTNLLTVKDDGGVSMGNTLITSAISNSLVGSLTVQNTTPYSAPNYNQLSQVWLNSGGGILGYFRNDGRLYTSNDVNSNYFVGNISGSISAPVFGVGSNGLFFPSSEIAFTTSSTEKMRITSAGNVGIGTATPLVKLQVEGTIQTLNNLNFYSTNNSRVLWKQVTGPSDSNLYLQYNDGASDFTRTTLTSTGNLGIGETSPTARLQIKGSGATSATTSLLVQNSSNAVTFQANDNQSVGIGIAPDGGTLPARMKINPLNSKIANIGGFNGASLPATINDGDLYLYGGNLWLNSEYANASLKGQLYKRMKLSGLQSDMVYASATAKDFNQFNSSNWATFGWGSLVSTGYSYGNTIMVNNPTSVGVDSRMYDGWLQSVNGNLSYDSCAQLYVDIKGSIFSRGNGTYGESDWKKALTDNANKTTTLGSETNYPSAKFSVDSTTQGALLPRMTTTQRNAIATPATGLIVYDTTLLSFYQYNGTAWTAVGGGGGTPSGVAGAIQFSNGSAFASDAANLFFDDTNNRLGIGINAPLATLHTKGSGATSATFSFRAENSTNTRSIIFTDEGKLSFNSSATSKMNIDSGTTTISFSSASSDSLTGGAVGIQYATGLANANGILYCIGPNESHSFRKVIQMDGGISANSYYTMSLVDGGATYSNTYKMIEVIPTLVLTGAGAKNVVGYSFKPTITASANTKLFGAVFENGGLLIGGAATAANASASLEVISTTQGLLPPRMTNAQVLAIVTPANGLMVYNTTIDHLCVYQAGAWVKINHSPM
jgi:hypothetical protein